MTDKQNLKFACAFCNYNSVHKGSVRSHFGRCTEKYNIQIDPKNTKFFRMVDENYFPNYHENKKNERTMLKQLKIKEKIEQKKNKIEHLKRLQGIIGLEIEKQSNEQKERFQIFVNSKIEKKIDSRISKNEILQEYSKMYLESNNDHKSLLSFIRNEGYIYKGGCFIDIQFKQ